MPSKAFVFDRDLIEKCQMHAPRYTSYPTADHFATDFTQHVQLQQINKVLGPNLPIEPLSLYIHIPFCNTLCLFCACNKIITNDKSKISRYLDLLELEIKSYFALIGHKLNVIQLHFGGGSPSWMEITELNRLMHIIQKYFNLDNALEIAMEIDPRHTTTEFIAALSANGFNRISLGVQDLDARVQKAVNRVQPFALTENILHYARELGFNSSNIDLIYGLPFQTVDGFARTIDKVIELKPERLALFNYAHIPSLFMPQTRISENELPSYAEKLDILQMSVTKLSEAGYIFIGMDHFALAHDPLAKAYLNGTMQRNFQGYSTFSDTNMLSFGVSAIGFLGNSYYQNDKNLANYSSRVSANELPIFRGFILDADDLMRRDIIQQIMCDFRLDFIKISESFQVDFSEYFAREILQLNEIADLGLIVFTNYGFMVTDTGRFLIRNVAVIFDKYYWQKKVQRYSKVI